MSDSTAIRGTTPSYSPALDAHQRGARATAPLSRGHHVHVVSNQPDKGFSDVSLPGLLTLHPVNWRRFCRRPFPHSRSDARTSRCCVRKRVCSIPLGQTRAYSMNVLACQPSRSKALQHEPLVSRTSPAGLIHHLRLSSVARLVGIDPNENGLTHGKQGFAPGAKAND